MGSRTQDIRALTLPHNMIVKAALLCYLVLTPAVFTFTVPEHAVAKKASSEVEARQFHDDDLINYGIWGFIAGLLDYGIRNSNCCYNYHHHNNNHYNYNNNYSSSKIQTKT